MTEPLFSIVTIAYRNLDGLRDTAESVRTQDFADYEHIVVDAGSDDGSAEWLAANFTGQWVSEPDRGRYHGMNKGARMSRGRYLWFLHSGDTFGDTGVLARVADAIAHHGDAAPDWLYGLARVLDADKTLVGTLGYAPFSLFNFAILQRPLPHQATAIDRNLFWELGGYDEDVPIAADQVLLMQAANRSMPMAMADFLCDFDGTGISAGRPWRDNLRDSRIVMRQLESPVLRSRTVDRAAVSAHTIARETARYLRDRATRSRRR